MQVTITATAPDTTITATAPDTTITATAPDTTITATAPDTTITATAPETTITDDTTITPELRQKIEDHIKYNDLYYVDYRDELDDKNLQKIIDTGSIDFDIYAYYEDDSYIQILKDIKKTFSLSKEFLEEHEDELRDIIYSTCSNDPLPDLVKNSGSQPANCYCNNCFYGKHRLASQLLDALDTIDDLNTQLDVSLD